MLRRQASTNTNNIIARLTLNNKNLFGLSVVPSFFINSNKASSSSSSVILNRSNIIIKQQQHHLASLKISNNNIINNFLFTSHRQQSSSSSSPKMTTTNPLLEKSPLPFNYPQFDKIKNEHYAPAFEVAMKQHKDEIEAIAENTAEPTFENTILAIENSGETLNRVNTIFSGLTSCCTNDDMQKLDIEISPKLSAHQDSMFLNEKLFNRIKALNDKKDSLNLDKESARLLWRYHLDFVRAGASVQDPASKEKLKGLNTDLATLQTQMQQKILAEVAASAVWFNDEKDLDGFDADEMQTAKDNAAAVEESKREGKYLVKLRNTTQQPVFVSLKNAETRKKILKASLARGSRGGPHDTREIITQIAKKRAERAQLLGFPDHASFQLADEMTRTPARAIDLLTKLAKPAVRNAMKEAEELKKFSGLGEKFCAADWDHFAEQLRAEKYAYDENMLKPYFEVESVYKNCIFFAANKLYGITFTERKDLPVYHPSVKVYDVKEEDGKQIAIFILDLYARDNKQGGAWMNDYVSQKGAGTNEFQVPVVSNNMNIPPPPPGKPTLIDFDMLTTCFHEIGHGLNSMVSNTKYEKFAGTNTPRDFVELPSQLNECFAIFPDTVKQYKHHETGEVIPQSLIDKVLKASKFNRGYGTSEYLCAALIDQAWHALKPEEVPTADKFDEFEASVLEKAGLKNDLVPPRYKSTYLAHCFAGGYSACYASYIASEVLDADCEKWFKDNGGMNRTTGDRFRKMILEKGGSEDCEEIVKNFLGREPNIEPLLERHGLN